MALRDLTIRILCSVGMQLSTTVSLSVLSQRENVTWVLWALCVMGQRRYLCGIATVIYIYLNS